MSACRHAHDYRSLASADGASDAVSAADGREALCLARLMLHSSALHTPVSYDEAALSIMPPPVDVSPPLEPVPAR